MKTKERNTFNIKVIVEYNNVHRPGTGEPVERIVNTLRKTISYLCKAGYIERIERGRYKRSKTIPDDMKITELEKMAYKRE